MRTKHPRRFLDELDDQMMEVRRMQTKALFASLYPYQRKIILRYAKALCARNIGRATQRDIAFIKKMETQTDEP
jgi:hypothetical protein